MKCGEAKVTALLVYEKKMSANLSKLPCDGDKILASHQAAVDESMTTFREETFGCSPEQISMDFEELMVRRTIQCFSSLARFHVNKF